MFRLGIILRHGATVTTVTLKGVARGKAHRRWRMCDGWPAGLEAGEDVSALPHFAHGLEHRHGGIRQRHLVLLIALHTLGGDRPGTRAEIDLVPRCAGRLAKAAGGERNELKASRRDARII